MAGIRHRQEERAPGTSEEPARARPAPAVPAGPAAFGPETVLALGRAAGNSAVARMLAGRALQRQPDGGTVAPPAPAPDGGAAAAPAPTREEKLAAFHEHVKASRWADAVLQANSWSIGDIETEVARPTVDHHARVAMYMQTLIVMWNWPQHVGDSIKKADKAAAVEGRKQFLHQARTKAQWDRWATALDGFESNADIAEMVGWLLPQELRALQDAARTAGSPARVTDPVSDALRLAVAAEMKKMVGEKATWQPSGGEVTQAKPPPTPDGGVPPAYSSVAPPTSFASWAIAATETPFPKLAAGVTINCWEMIMLAAYRAGALGWQWIHDLYTASASPPSAWYGKLEAKLTPKGRTVFPRTGPPAKRPRAGDIVMFNGADHVTLATGSQKPNGDPELYTFWPPPNNFSSDPFGRTDDVVKKSSVEELAQYMDKNKMGPVTVTFGAPPW